MNKLIYILLFLVTSLAYSQIDVPRYIAYQGVLIDKSKQLKPDGNYSIKFELYDSEFGGNLIWNKSFNPIKVTNGMFGELLGPFDANLKFDRQYFIQITVDNEQLNKRVPLTSSAYSLGIANNSVSTEKIQNLAVTDSKIDNLTISTNKLKDFSITETKLDDISVSNRTVQADAIDSNKIKNNSISYNDLTTQSATNGNVLTFNNSTWQPQAPSGVPIGTILAYAFENLPSDGKWLVCDGSTVPNVSDFQEFRNLLQSNGHPWGIYKVPDLRGMFLRGWNDNRTDTLSDPNRANRFAFNGGASGNKVGSYQADAFQGHWHELYLNSGAASNNPLTNLGSSNFQLEKTVNNEVKNAVTDNSNGSPRTSSETRPKNAYVLYIIKAR